MAKEIKKEAKEAKGAGGVAFENAIVAHAGLVPEPEHRHKWDAYRELEDRKVGIAIKHCNVKNEMVFDLKVQANLDEEGFYLLVGMYEGKDRFSVDHIHLVTIKTSDWLDLMNLDMIEELKHIGHYLEDHLVYKGEWEKIRDSFNKEWEETTPNIIRPRLRAYYGKDGRVLRYRFQCAITASTFRKKFIEEQMFNIRRAYSQKAANGIMMKHLRRNPELLEKARREHENRRIKEEEKVRLEKERLAKKEKERSQRDLEIMKRNMNLFKREIVERVHGKYGHAPGCSISELYDLSMEKLKELDEY